MITYEDKVQLQDDSSIEDIYKCKADNLNEIKTVVNENYEELQTLETTVQTLATKVATPKLKVLWQNSSPTSSFSSQTVTLSSDDYDYLIVFYKFYGTGTQLSTELALKGFGAYLNIASDYNAGSATYYSAGYIRTMSRSSDTSFSFSSCYVRYGSSTSRTEANSYLVPYAIYGGKF